MATTPSDLIPPKALEGLKDLPKSRKYLVGVSGGADSVALLHLLHEGGYKNLVVCHLDHGLRGDDSIADGKFVEALSMRLKYPFQKGSVDVSELAGQSGKSIELAAREARYEFFAQVARETRCSRLILGHHADDQVETVLMNLFRGSGLRGLGGMEAINTRKVGRKTLDLYRPLLQVARGELGRYIVAWGHSYREDESNTDEAYLRNRVRHKLMPMVEEVFGRDVRGAVLRLSDLAGLDDAFMGKLANEVLEKVTGEEGLMVKKLRELPSALLGRVLATWIRSNGVTDVGKREIDLARTLLPEGAEVAKINLPGGWHLRRRAGVLFLEAP